MRGVRLSVVVWVALCLVAVAVPSRVETLPGGMTVVYDDAGMWDRNLSLSITHQNKAGYEARKTLDTSGVPAAVWAAAREVRLAAMLSVREYSWHDLDKANGLDEAIEVVVNGNVTVIPTGSGLPVYQENNSVTLAWHDLALPKEYFRHGVNEVIFRKAAQEKGDDYLYLAIDHSLERGNSAVDFGDGRGWRTDTLTIPGGRGEYMVRLYLPTGDSGVEAVWSPGGAPALADPAELVVFQGSRLGQVGAAGLLLAAGQSAQLEWEGERLEARHGLEVEVSGSGAAALSWIAAGGRREEVVAQALPFTVTAPVAGLRCPRGLVLTASGGAVTLTRVRLAGSLACRPLAPPPPDQRPDIASPAGAASARTVRCAVAGGEAVLENAGLRARFGTAGARLRLLSLYNEWAAAEMVRQPEAVDLFLVEVGGRRSAGSRDFALEAVTPVQDGFRATLREASMGLRAVLDVAITAEGLRLGLELENAGAADCEVKVAFPHLAGLALSAAPVADYYFFPWSGLFGDRPAVLRRGYGDHEALYQVMDLFSPERGAGLYLRLDEAEGWHKVLTLRKTVPGQSSWSGDASNVRTRPEFTWSGSLPAVEGIGMACEYLRRTRAPGERFVPAAAVLAAHPGDWRVAMRAYADWAHRVWSWRPYPSRLTGAHTMTAHGWAQDVLFRDGAYRTDFIKPMADCVEVMSWWDWSPLGPLGAPMDDLGSRLTPAQIARWRPYFAKDPVRGQLKWNNQPGDYRGYNQGWGGLEAFRKAVATWKSMGPLVTLYTDPFRLDAFSCETGRRFGEVWCVMGPDGAYPMAYEVTNPCHDLPEVRAWAIETMKRVMIETGADGIRLDEYGHMGWACFNPAHRHTYGELGVSQWNKAVAETTAGIRAAMDEVDPRSVLTTEHPCYDYLMRCLDGCITYDVTVQATPLRPLEVNLQRFYFPECKAYELDHRHADRQDRKKFWNGVASFGRILPKPFYVIYDENEDVFSSRDCEALVPTLVPRLYANRFRGGGKTFVHLYNATGRTQHGPL
ncbi:MAG: hypothetical protein GX595_19250, partial [Lentisphaerae bacterium]|nr:hypothetical protein [Lentisphaerota bacterium]